MKGKYLGKNKKYLKSHDMWECPYCGKITFQDRRRKNGIVIVEEVLGCKHWTGTGDMNEYFGFEKEVK